MPNIALLLKDEIRRVAKRVVRQETQVTRRAATAHRREIAALKRLIKQQSNRMAMLESMQRGNAGATTSADNDDEKQLRFSSSWVRKHRNKLKVSAAHYGKLIGVSGQTVYHWETGKARPRRKQLAQLAAVRRLGRRAALARLSMPSTGARRGRPKAK